jgi:hypothetical protein
MVERGGVAQSPDGKLWFVLRVDDEKIALRGLDDNKVMLSLLRGGERGSRFRGGNGRRAGNSNFREGGRRLVTGEQQAAEWN